MSTTSPPPEAQPSTQSSRSRSHAVSLEEAIDEAVAAINRVRLWQPQVAIILGSGLGGLGDDVQHATRIPYASIPHFQSTHALGHAGQLVLGFLAGVPVVVMQGRYHRYEGHSRACVVFPVQVMGAMGAKTLVVTNAAGGLNPRYAPGDLMLVDQHINCLWPRMHNHDWTVDGDGAREVSAAPTARHSTVIYDPALLQQAGRIARQHEVNLQRGTYVATLGPTYETRSEYRMFRWMGGDAVGMSTVPEVLAARQAGMRVLAMSVITNVACTDQAQGTNHDEVVQQGQEIAPRLRRIVQQLLGEMAGPAD